MAVALAFGTLSSAVEIAAALSDAIQGKYIIATGVFPASLGFATACAFASQNPKNLSVTGRSTTKASVRAAVAQINADDTVPTIDILVSNAGVMAIPTPTLSEDGIETTFATNHVGHFLFTNLILPKMIKASRTPSTPTRITNVTSFGHRFSTTPDELPEAERPDLMKTALFTGSSQSQDTYYGFFSYAQSKTANILYSISLNQKLAAKYGIAPYAINQALERLAELGIDPTTKSLDQGANTSVLAAADRSLAPVDTSDFEVKGVYLADCKFDDENIASFAKNKLFAERFWTLTEKLVNQDFGIYIP